MNRKTHVNLQNISAWFEFFRELNMTHALNWTIDLAAASEARTDDPHFRTSSFVISLKKQKYIDHELYKNKVQILYPFIFPKNNFYWQEMAK